MEKSWDGSERRRCPIPCDAHVEISSAVQKHDTMVAVMQEKLTTLVESVGEIKEYLKAQNEKRTTWWIAISGIIVGVLIQTAVFCYWLGQISKQIEIDHQSIQQLWDKR